MKILVFVFLSMLASGFIYAQGKNPVKWEFSAKKINATTYEVQWKAKLDKSWHMYSQTTPAGGPVATSFSFNRNPLLTFEGSVKEKGKLEQRYEDLFDVEVKQFSDKVEFTQVVKLKAAVKTNISGSVEFMTCNDRECLPPKTEKFSIALK